MGCCYSKQPDREPLIQPNGVSPYYDSGHHNPDNAHVDQHHDNHQHKGHMEHAVPAPGGDLKSQKPHAHVEEHQQQQQHEHLEHIEKDHAQEHREEDEEELKRQKKEEEEEEEEMERVRKLQEDLKAELEVQERLEKERKEKEEQERLERIRKANEPPLVVLEDQIPLEGREPIGAIELAIEHEPQKARLALVVHQARGLVNKEGNNAGDCNPFLKVWLIKGTVQLDGSVKKEKLGNQKGNVRNGTNAPEFEQTFLFEDVKREELDAYVLSVAMFHHRQIKVNNYLGELRFRLGKLTTLTKRRAWYPLAVYNFEKPTMDEATLSNIALLSSSTARSDVEHLVQTASRHKANNGKNSMHPSDYEIAGIKVKVKYDEGKEKLDIFLEEVIEAEYPIFPGFESLYINGLLLPDRSHKQKTKTFPRTRPALVNQSFTFEIAPNDLEDKKIELALKVGKNNFLGCAVLDLLGKSGDFEEDLVLNVEKISQNRQIEKGKAVLNKAPIPNLVLKSNNDLRSTSGNLDKKHDSLGELSAGAYYDSSQKKLIVTINEGRNLKAFDSNGFSDPYVVVKIVPDDGKRFKEQRTKTCKKTLNPVFREKFEFSMKPNELQTYKLNLMMWDSDTIGRDFMGELTFDLAKIPMDFRSPEWHELGKRNCGELNLRINLNDAQMELTIEVIQAKNLLSTRPTGLLDPYVKIYLQPDKGKHTKRKTETIKHTDSPLFNEKLEPYDLNKVSNWRTREIVVSVHDDEPMTKHAEIGSVIIPMEDVVKERVFVKWYPLLKLFKLD